MPAARTKKTTTANRSRRQSTQKGPREIKLRDFQKLLAQSHASITLDLSGKKFRLSKDECHHLATLIQHQHEPSAAAHERVLTTQEVADLLNVSRPYVTKLIDMGKLNSFKVGNQRRVRAVDALEYRKKMRGDQKEALDALAEETQSLGFEFE